VNRIKIEITVYANDAPYSYEHIAEAEVSFTAPLELLSMLEMGDLLGNLYVDTVRQAIRQEKAAEQEAA